MQWGYRACSPRRCIIKALARFRWCAVKLARVLTRSGYDLASHDGKALKAILEFMPRDELFQYDEDD